MTLLDLIRRQTEGTRRDILVVAAISGVSNAALMAVVNSAVQGGTFDGPSLRMALLFAIAFVLYVVTFRRMCDRVTQVLERILLDLRVRIADKIRFADLLSLERLDQGALYNLLTSQARVLSESASILAVALQSSIMLVAASLYLATISLPAFVFCVALLAVSIPAHLSRSRRATLAMRETSDQEVVAFNAIRDLLDGFKEVRLNERRSAALMREITDSATTLGAMKVRTADIFNVNFLSAYGAFYVMIGAVIFILPRLVALPHGDMVKVMMTVLFIIGPLSSVITGLQALQRSNVAVRLMHELETQLDRSTLARRAAPARGGGLPAPFREIRMEGIRFDYRDADGASVFSVGPLDLTIHRGEVLFVMGGNGSGKTTALKLLTRLYDPAGGRLSVDGVEIDASNVGAYRNLYSAIFSDFHLFPKLYGLEGVDPERVRAMLRQFRIESKTAFLGDRFTTLELSTGQRKRLAMIVALLEDRPAYVFDEWAADQDPAFRRYYYEELLPSLAAEGKTIVAVTHDDRYLHTAGRVVKMELGQIESVGRHTGPGEETERS